MRISFSNLLKWLFHHSIYISPNSFGHFLLKLFIEFHKVVLSEVISRLTIIAPSYLNNFLASKYLSLMTIVNNLEELVISIRNSELLFQFKSVTYMEQI